MMIWEQGLHGHKGVKDGADKSAVPTVFLVWVKYVWTLGDGAWLRPEAAACILWPVSGSAASQATPPGTGTLGAEHTKQNLRTPAPTSP